MDPSSDAFPFDRYVHSAPGATKVLEKSVIESLLDLGADDGELLIELIDLFGEDASQRVNDVVQAESRGDMSTTARATHVLKSASANIGALGFSSLCREIETLAKRGGGESLMSMVAQLQSMFDEVSGALGDLRRSYERNRA